MHARAEALQAATIALEAGFDNFNVDLMFGLPQQTLAEALLDLQTAIALKPTHLSWYQLTLEPNTLFYKHPPVLPDDDALADMQLAGLELLQQQGYAQYEVSAYAQPNRQCQHNLNYWQFGDYIGIGAGAHGKITQADGRILRYQKYRQPQQYLQQSQSAKLRSESHYLQPNDIVFEFMLNALRLKNGFTLDLFTARTGLTSTALDSGLRYALEHELLALHQQHIHATERGWQLLNTVIELFLEE